MNIEIELDNGKYTYILDEKGQRVLRYGLPWRDIEGDNFILLMALEIDDLRKEMQELKKVLD